MITITIGVIVIFFLFISPITKFLIEKYDVKYTGRQITLDRAYVNPFTGFVRLRNIKIQEAKKDTLFLTAKEVSADFSMWKLFSKTYEVSELIINQPRGTVVQSKGKRFNFDDIIKRFSPDTLDRNRTPTHLNILKVKIVDGEFYYHEKVIPIYYVVKSLNMESSGKRWDADTIASTFSFLSQNGKGAMQGHFTINFKTLDYRFGTVVRNFDLEIIRQYLWELINYGMFSAQLDARIQATGNFKNPNSVDARGRFAFNHFHLGKTIKDDYVAFDKLVINIDRVNPANLQYLFDTIAFYHPFFKYEKFDSLNNIERLFGKAGANIAEVTGQPGRFNLVIEIGRYLKKLSRNFFRSPYRVNSFKVENGDVRFSDFSLNEQFSISANSLNIKADSVDKKNKRVKVYIASGVKPYGDLAINLSINPKDSGDFDMTYHLSKVPVSMFNPYIISYTSFPLDRGILELQGLWNVREGNIKSENHIILLDPRVSKRIRNKNLKWIPLPLAMLFIRERGNMIDYQIPISGNLKSPHFHLRDAVADLIKNIFVKPVTVPYGIALRETENEIENSLSLTWSIRQNSLSGHQKRFVNRIAKFLKKNPESSIIVHLHEYPLKEKEQILFFEAKRKYFLAINNRKLHDVSTEDSLKINMMSIKDARFMHSLQRGRGAGDTILFSIQEKCRNYVGSSRINSIYIQLAIDRNVEFLKPFIENDSRAQVHIVNVNDSIPFNGFSFFKILYKGDIPKSLRRAYKEMHEINDESLRKKYFKVKA
ncbi:MAG TPA: DUF748 domain-containing protein [Cyclobacteriaceae bacterium]|jgi:hypothetical protein|nr:DUF748 domain-containing protein [Cyclobacteriaceae bacterium]